MGAGVEMDVESGRPRHAGASSLEIRLLGTLAIIRAGTALVLPASRKARALFAYLSLAPHPVPRSQLCELLWDIPNDPRGELRWCLSKIRKVIDEPRRRRVDTQADAVSLDLRDCFVDAIEVAETTRKGVETIAPDRLKGLVVLFGGDLLEGLDIERSPGFNAWLTAQRRRFRGCQAAMLQRLAESVSDEEVFGYLDKWLELAPFDRRAHELLLSALARHNRVREGEEHLAATARLYEEEGLDYAPIRAAWQSVKEQGDISPPAHAAMPAAEVTADSGRDNIVAVASRRASVAVMPFTGQSAGISEHGGAAHALVHDVITRLAKLRSLFVIAQGTVFALHARHIGPEEAGRTLDVDYVVSGTARLQGNRLMVIVELAEVRTARIVWAETFNKNQDDAFLVLDEIGNRVVASIANEIETIERNRAILKPPNSLDAWEAHHRGLWHMYRFNKPDNQRANQFFQAAVRLDPTFSRAYAGLSFTHWQNAFQGWAPREREVDRACAAAEQSLMADDRDPAAHWAMGRTLWLQGRHEQSIVELEQSIELSPNFAQGHYSLAFVLAQAGDPAAAISSSDYSRQLSPFDPLLFGMLGARALALVRLGRFDDAANWAIKAAARPNAHSHILAIAAFSLALAGRLDEARAYLASIHATLPRYGVDDFFAAFQFAPEGLDLFREGAKRIGIG